MLINKDTEVYGERVVLVPYDAHLVSKYHEWMKSEELLKQTASEPLTLEQEYDMQKSWRTDNDRLTFIVLENTKKSNDGDVSAMIGDTNLFFSDPEVAEVMVMIAETSYRRQGYGKEAVLLLLRYGIEELGIKKYEAKISRENSISVQLFLKIGFIVESESEVFNEFTLARNVTEDWISNIFTNQKYKKIQKV